MTLVSRTRKSLARFLISPTKVAQSLNWKRGSNVLSLNIGRKAIEIAVASRPSSHYCASHYCDNNDHYNSNDNDSSMLQPLPSIPVKLECAVVNKIEDGKGNMSKKKVLHPEVVEQLASIVEDWNICGLVVNWPLEDEGWCGARCGRVLHTLDQILEQSDVVINENRPVCLWNDEHSYFAFAEDKWGRSSIYSHMVNEAHYVSSEENQHKDSSMVPVHIWNDFCIVHWPELYKRLNDGDYDDQNEDELDAVA